MKRLILTLAVLIAGSMRIAGHALADDAKPAADASAVVMVADKPTDISIDETAGQLAEWSRDNHDPIGLAMAARVLASAPTREMENPDKQVEAPPSAGAPTVSSPAFTPQALLNEAKSMTNDKDKLAAIDEIEKSMPPLPRRAIDGAHSDHDVIAPDGTTTYNITFAGGEPMEMTVFSNGNNAVEWHVYNEHGDEMQSKICDHFLAVPEHTEKFKIVLKNVSKDYIAYTLLTN